MPLASTTSKPGRSVMISARFVYPLCRISSSVITTIAAGASKMLSSMPEASVTSISTSSAKENSRRSSIS